MEGREKRGAGGGKCVLWRYGGCGWVGGGDCGWWAAEGWGSSAGHQAQSMHGVQGPAPCAHVSP